MNASDASKNAVLALVVRLSNRRRVIFFMRKITRPAQSFEYRIDLAVVRPDKRRQRLTRSTALALRRKTAWRREFTEVAAPK